MNASSIDVIRLVGELEIGRKEALRGTLAIRSGARAVLVDLSEVTYADSTALTELLRFCSDAKERRIPVAIVGGTPQFARIIKYAGLADAFTIFDDRADALTYLSETTRS